MKHIITLVAFNFCLTTITFAQTTTFKHSVQGSVGFSLTGVLFTDIIPDSISINPVTYSSDPAIQLSYDYFINQKFSVGFGLSYQKFALASQNNTVVFLDNALNPMGGDFSSSISRANFGIKLLYHYKNNDKLDIYSGARLGVTRWTTKVTLEGDTSPWNTFKNTIPAPQFIPIGLRYYFVNNKLGVGFETGIGAPHFLNLSINYRM